VTPALLLAGHGTRDPEGVAGFTALTRRLSAREHSAGGPASAAPGRMAPGRMAPGRMAPGRIDVAGGFIELSEPPLRDAVAELAAGGHRTLVAVPLMLSAAGHSKGDVPAALARETARHPGLVMKYGRPLGPHPVLLSLLADRIAVAARGAAGPYAVLVVGRGTTDPDANAEVCKDARLLWEGRDYEFTEAAFVSLARPSVAEGLERCRRLGARTIVVARYFLFAGVLPDRVGTQAAAFAAAHPGLDIRCSDVLGDCDEIAGLVIERYHEAIAGDIRMNCDVCQYRTALPGLAHRVGAPQRPHDHPHDHEHAHDDGPGREHEPAGLHDHQRPMVPAESAQRDAS
jgi:sirohydrochlorin cobaltochelatase